MCTPLVVRKHGPTSWYCVVMSLRIPLVSGYKVLSQHLGGSTHATNILVEAQFEMDHTKWEW